MWEQHGAFTTAAICDGKLLFRHRHVERWQATLVHLGLDATPWRNLLWQEADKMAAAATTPMLIRISTTATTAALHPRPVTPSLTSLEGQPVTLCRRLPEWKTLYYSDVLDALNTTDRQTTEPLLCSTAGTLLEGATTGLLARSGKTLILPAGPALPSITTRQLIAAIGDAYSITSAPINLDSLNHIDEFIIAGSGRAAIPLHAIHNTKWQPGEPELAEKARHWSKLQFKGWFE